MNKKNISITIKSDQNTVEGYLHILKKNGVDNKKKWVKLVLFV
jgi:hypothetical protein